MNEFELSEFTHKSNSDISVKRLIPKNKNSDKFKRRHSSIAKYPKREEPTAVRHFDTEILSKSKLMEITDSAPQQTARKDFPVEPEYKHITATPLNKTGKINAKPLFLRSLRKAKKEENENLLEESKKNVVNRNLKRQSKNIKTFIHNIIGRISITGKMETGREKEFISKILAPSQIKRAIGDKKRSLSTFNVGKNNTKRSGSMAENMPKKIYSSIENRPKSLENETMKNNMSFEKIVETNSSKKTAKKFKTLREEIVQNINREDTDDSKKEERKLKNFQNVYDSFSDDEYQSDEKEHGCVLDNTSIWKQAWDFTLLLCVLYSCTVEPFMLSFGKNDSQLIALDVIIDCFFLIDLIFNFFTPYYHLDEILIMNPRKIMCNYLQTWFAFDLITSFPTSFLTLLHANISNYAKGIIKITRIYKMSRWLRVFRLARLSRSDSKGQLISDIKVNEDNGVNRIFKFLLFFCILTHIASCVWIYIGNEMEDIYIDGQSWITYYNLQDASVMDIYTCAIYFSLVTIFTIGYGDITAHNVVERIYNIFFMFIGVLLFSFTISALSTIFSRISEEKKKLRSKFSLLEDLHKEYNIPQNLYNKIKKTIKFQQKKVSIEKFELLDTLPYALRKEVILSMNKKGISNITLFKDQDRDFVIYVLPLLRSLQICKFDTLIAIGDYVEEMYIVLKGVLSIRMEKFYDNLEIAQIRANSHFGEVFMYLNENSPYLINCKTERCDLLILKKEDYTKIKLAFNENVLMILKNSCQFLENIEKTKKVVLELYNNGESLKKIKSHLKRLNSFLLKRQFDGFYYYDLLIEEAEDFILSHDIDDIIVFLKSDMKESDFVDCFLKEKSNRKLSRVASTGSNSSKSSKGNKNKNGGKDFGFLHCIGKCSINAQQANLNAIEENSEDSNISSQSKSSEYDNISNLNNSVRSAKNNRDGSRKFSNLLDLNSNNKRRRVTQDYQHNKIGLGIYEENDLNLKMKELLSSSQKENTPGSVNTGRKARMSIFSNSNLTSNKINNFFSPIQTFNANISNKPRKNSIFQSLQLKKRKTGSFTSDFSKSRNSVFSGNSGNSQSDTNKAEFPENFKIFNLYNYENNFNQNYFINNKQVEFTVNKADQFEIKSLVNKEKESEKTKKSETFDSLSLVMCQNYNMSFFDNKLISEIRADKLEKEYTLFGSILQKTKSNRTIDEIIRTKRKFPSVDESSNFSMSPPKNSKNHQSSIMLKEISPFEEIPRRCSSTKKLPPLTKNSLIQDSNLIFNFNTSLNPFTSQSNYSNRPSEVSFLLDRSSVISKQNKSRISQNSSPKHKMNNYTKINSISKPGSPTHSHHNSNIISSPNVIQLKSLSSKKKSILLNKENLFDKVSNGLQLDEIFHLDKYYLMDNINSFIQEREEYTKIAHTCLRKLDRMINNLNLDRSSKRKKSEKHG